MYDKLVAKVNFDTSGFVLKTKYDTDKSDFENKISDGYKKILDTSGCVKKTDYNTKITKIESKIPSISGLASTTTLTIAENKYLMLVIQLKKKKPTDCNTKNNEIKKKITDHNLDK